MPDTPSLSTVMATVKAHVGPLARDVLDGAMDRLDGRIDAGWGTDPAMQFLLGDALRRKRVAFVESFRNSLEDALQHTTEPTLGQRPLQNFNPESLSLVDEYQAQEDVAVAGVIKAIDDQSSGNLHQLHAFFSALKGTGGLDVRDNPVRPAIFARALAQAMRDLSLDTSVRLGLLRPLGSALAVGLTPLYGQLCSQLQHAKVLPMLARTALRSSPTRSGLPYGDTATMEGLMQRVQQHESSVTNWPTVPQVRESKRIPSLFDRNASSGMSAFPDLPPPDEPDRPVPGRLNERLRRLDFELEASLNRLNDQTLNATNAPKVLRYLLKRPDPTLEPLISQQVMTLLAGLFDQIMADERLHPPVKALLCRLQISVLRVAMNDESLTDTQDHPTWQFFDAVSAHCLGYSRNDDTRLEGFLIFLRNQVAQLAAHMMPTAQVYQRALGELDQFILEQSRAVGRHVQSTLETLERSQQREEWRLMLRQQVHAQLRGAIVSGAIREFLQGPWVDAIAEAMGRHGPYAPDVQPLIDLVDDLLWSVQPHSEERDRDQLRGMLPHLLERLEQGFDLIRWSQTKRAAFLRDLMIFHQRLLRMPVGALLKTDEPPGPHKRTEDLDPEELVHRWRTAAASASRYASTWGDSEVDRSILATVPVALISQTESQAGREALDSWMRHLRVGNWFHMFIRSEWITAQLSGISDGGRFFIFVGQVDGQTQSLTRGAVEKLLVAGLITALEDRTLVQRAMDSMMQDMDGHPSN